MTLLIWVLLYAVEASITL